MGFMACTAVASAQVASEADLGGSLAVQGGNEPAGKDQLSAIALDVRKACRLAWQDVLHKAHVARGRLDDGCFAKVLEGRAPLGVFALFILIPMHKGYIGLTSCGRSMNPWARR